MNGAADNAKTQSNSSVRSAAANRHERRGSGALSAIRITAPPINADASDDKIIAVPTSSDSVPKRVNECARSSPCPSSKPRRIALAAFVSQYIVKFRSVLKMIRNYVMILILI